MSKVSVLFVCLGNICRSPTAHGMFRDLVETEGFSNQIKIDSAGTGDWHVGRPPDTRATEHAIARGMDISDLRARQVSISDFDQFDYVLAMDAQNLADLQMMAPAGFAGHMGLFLEFAPDYEDLEVPDPYYGGARGFELVMDMVQNGCEGLLAHLRETKGL